MKRVLFTILISTLIAVFYSCGNRTSDSATSTAPGSDQSKPGKGPEGTYSAVEDGKPMQFVINADGTGLENYQGMEKRPFTWKSKDGGIFFTYDGEAQEWELPIDIGKGEIAYGSLVYKKE